MLGNLGSSRRTELLGVVPVRAMVVDVTERRGIYGSHLLAASVDWGSCRQV